VGRPSTLSADRLKNENFPFQVAQALRGLGHDVLTSLEAGNANQSIPDEQVLEFATQNRRALLTINKRDFIQLHKVNQSHASIIVCSQDADTGGQAKRIHQEISSQLSLVLLLFTYLRLQPNVSQVVLSNALVLQDAGVSVVGSRVKIGVVNLWI
jgi:hypothetical protein